MSNENGPVERRPEPRKNVPWVWIIISAALAVAVVALVLANRFGSRVTEFDRPEPPKGPNIVATTTEPPPIAPPVVTTEPPPPEPGKPPKPQPPAEVVRYLEHLKRVEAYRQGMRNDVNPALEMLKSAYASQFGFGFEDDEGSQKKLHDGYSKYVRDWQNLTRYFRALPPPQQCSKLAAAYGQALTSYVAVMNNIQVAMKTGDLSALLQMRGGAQGNVDRMLKLSDSELEAVCKTYDITKQFDIVTDSDVGSILGF